MRIVVEADLFSRSHSPEEHSALLSLFGLGLASHHAVEVRQDGSPAFRKWLGQRDRDTQALCERALDIGVKRSVRRRRLSTVHVADIPAPSWKDRRLPVEVALKLARRPLTLLLENSRNERAFLRVVTRLRKDFDLEALQQKGVVDCRTHGGIDENRKWLETYGQDPELALRCWVMCDSDARRPWKRAADGTTSPDLGRGAKAMDECCKQRGLRLHILERRFIESYLPPPAIQSWSSLKPARLHEHVPFPPSEREAKYEALTRLRPEQRHHYNMKKGFAQDKKDSEHEKKVGDLYTAVEQAVLDVLHDGIDENIADLFHEEDFRIHKPWITQDGQTAEVDKIVDSIVEML